MQDVEDSDQTNEGSNEEEQNCALGSFEKWTKK